jgi:hypothetical protein
MENYDKKQKEKAAIGRILIILFNLQGKYPDKMMTTDQIIENSSWVLELMGSKEEVDRLMVELRDKYVILDDQNWDGIQSWRLNLGEVQP